MDAVRKNPFLILTLYVSFLIPSGIHAQSEPLFTATDPDAIIRIKIEPQNPAPGDTAHLSVVGGPLVDLGNSTITWFQNGKSVSRGVGNTGLDVKVGALGQALDIVVQVTAPDGSISTESLSIIPTHIDLLIDADSYTPPFYRGRALPSAGTRLHVQALTYFKRAGGTFIPSSSINYTWRQNGQVLGTLSGKGRQTVILPSPVLYGTDTISVDAVSVDGTLRGSASVRLSSVDPLLVLYEDHPLFGIMYHRAMGKTTSIPDSEMTFVAVPYFAEAQSPTDPRLKYTWGVSGTDAPTNESRPNEITINADKSKGEAVVELSVSHATNFFTNMKDVWDIVFRTVGQADNPFSTGFF